MGLVLPLPGGTDEGCEADSEGIGEGARGPRGLRLFAEGERPCLSPLSRVRDAGVGVVERTLSVSRTVVCVEREAREEGRVAGGGSSSIKCLLASGDLFN